MNAQETLANVHLASPCRARWQDMAGNERARFCSRCHKHVYNLSRMTAAEAAALVLEKEGHLCARFYERGDGTILTADCPMGVAQLWGGLTKLVAIVATVFLAGIGLGSLARRDRTQPPGETSAAVVQACNEIVWPVRRWLGLMPVKAGGVRCRPAPPPPPAANTLPPGND